VCGVVCGVCVFMGVFSEQVLLFVLWAMYASLFGVGGKFLSFVCVCVCVCVCASCV